MHFVDEKAEFQKDEVLRLRSQCEQRHNEADLGYLKQICQLLNALALTGRTMVMTTLLRNSS